MLVFFYYIINCKQNLILCVIQLMAIVLYQPSVMISTSVILTNTKSFVVRYFIFVTDDNVLFNQMYYVMSSDVYLYNKGIWYCIFNITQRINPQPKALRNILVLKKKIQLIFLIYFSSYWMNNLIGKLISNKYVQ